MIMSLIMSTWNYSVLGVRKWEWAEPFWFIVDLMILLAFFVVWLSVHYVEDEKVNTEE